MNTASGTAIGKEVEMDKACKFPSTILFAGKEKYIEVLKTS